MEKKTYLFSDNNIFYSDRWLFYPTTPDHVLFTNGSSGSQHTLTVCQRKRSCDLQTLSPDGYRINTTWICKDV